MSEPPTATDTATVFIDKVIPLPAGNYNGNVSKTTNPSVITFRKGTVPETTKGVTLSVRKRRHPNSSASNDAPDTANPNATMCGENELFARARDGRVWRAAPGFSEVNCNYYIGVRRKSTGNMSLIQVDSLYSLRPHVAHATGASPLDDINRSNAPNASAYADDEDDDVANKSIQEKRRDLLDAFGGKRSILRARRAERNYISEDKVASQTAMQITDAATEMVAQDAEQGIVHNKVTTTASSAPPHDPTATTPITAYPLLGLVSPQELSELSDAAALLSESVEDGLLAGENPGWHPLVWSVLTSIIDSRANAPVSDSDESDATMRLQCAMHVHYLITLARAPPQMVSRVREQLISDMAVSETTLTQLLQRFTTVQLSNDRREVRVRTKTDMDCIAKYAIIMWMYALGFSNCGQVNGLADALGVPFKSFLWFCRSIGCKVRKLKDADGPEAFRITLATPLVFPSVQNRKLGRQKKRKA